MDWATWIGFTASALAGAVMTLGGVWFYIRRNQLQLRGAETEQDAKVSSSWRELMEYKSEDFRKKNEEQDARTAAMLIKMDIAHANHLKCELDAAEREVEYKRGAVDKEIKLAKHEARIVELTELIASLRADMENLRSTQCTTAELMLKTAADVAAAKVLTEARVAAAKLVTDADNTH